MRQDRLARRQHRREVVHWRWIRAGSLHGGGRAHCRRLNRAALPEERHLQVDHRLAAPGGLVAASLGEGADDGTLHVVAAEDLPRLGQLLRGDGGQHPLLRFRQQHLPGGEALVFQRHRVQIKADTGVLAHLAGGTGDAASAQVGDGADAAGIAQVRDRLHELALDDRVADLNGGSFFLGRLPGHLGGAGGGAV